MNLTPKVVVIHVIWQREDHAECLLIRQAQGPLKGNWQTPGGKLLEGESVGVGALRELKEETGRTPSTLYYADFSEIYCIPSKNEMICSPVFVAFLNEKEPIVLSPNEHDEYQWLSLKNAYSLLEFAGQRDGLHHIEREFRMETGLTGLNEVALDGAELADRTVHRTQQVGLRQRASTGPERAREERVERLVVLEVGIGRLLHVDTVAAHEPADHRGGGGAAFGLRRAAEHRGDELLGQQVLRPDGP